MRDTGSRHFSMQGEKLMPRTPAPAGVRLARMHVAFAFVLTPVTFGCLVVYVLASNHLISYWWFALTLGWGIVPLAILVRALRYARPVPPAQPSQSLPLVHQD
jgi:hypothetical protein